VWLTEKWPWLKDELLRVDIAHVSFDQLLPGPSDEKLVLLFS
jgi:hypothetical protein